MSDTTIKSLPKVSGFSLSRPRLLPLFVYFALLLGVSLFFVWSRIAIVNLEYDISRLGSRLRAVEQENKGLRLEAAHLRSPGRLEKVALNQLGLRSPSVDQIIIVD